MKDTEILAYLESHAPLRSFYLFMSEDGSVLMKYFDASGRSWNIMEDDDKTVTQVAAFLRRSGAKVFNDFSALLQFEQEEGRQN